MKLGTRETVEVPSIPTGSFGLDNALGIGGLPKGRVVEIYGPESSGKTTLTLISECIRRTSETVNNNQRWSDIIQGSDLLYVLRHIHVQGNMAAASRQQQPTLVRTFLKLECII